MTAYDIDVEIEDPAWTAALADCAAVARSAAETALSSLSARPGRAPVRAGGSALGIAILLAGDAAVRELNARFRGRDAATNVLSFPASPSAAPFLGDVALAYGVCAREAAAQGKTLSAHLSHLTVHGVLHLLGFDHEAEADAEAMEDMERRILSQLGVPDPYAGES